MKHIDELYQGELNKKVKKIRTRGGEVNVKVRVTNAGETFYASCFVSRDGDLTYSTDRQITNAIVSKDS